MFICPDFTFRVFEFSVRETGRNCVIPFAGPASLGLGSWTSFAEEAGGQRPNSGLEKNNHQSDD